MKKGLKFYQTRSNAVILHEPLPAYCLPKVVWMETGEVLYEKVYMSPRLPPKISLKPHWKRELGSETRRTSCEQSRSFQSNQPIPNPSRDRTGQPVVGTNTRTLQDGRNTSRSQEIDTRSFHEEAVKTDRTGQPVVETSRTQTRPSDDSKSFNVEDKAAHDRTGQHVVNRDESGHEQTMLNEVNMDFRIPGSPHSVVKHAQSSSVRELVQKIENHPDRHALQQGLRYNKAYNPFSPESKRMIQDVGNVELFELLETDSQNAVQSMPIILE